MRGDWFTAEQAGAAWRELQAMLLPQACLGCGAGVRRVCGSCRSALAATPSRVVHNGIELWRGPDFAGAVASVLRQLKSTGESDLVQLAGAELRRIAQAALAETAVDAIVLPPVRPAAKRQRGFDPIGLLSKSAGLRVLRPFRFSTAVADQRSLRAAEREANLAEGLQLRRAIRLDGARCALLDDIVTTGATLRALERAVVQNGGSVELRMVLAATPRQKPLAPSAAAE